MGQERASQVAMLASTAVVGTLLRAAFGMKFVRRRRSSGIGLRCLASRADDGTDGHAVICQRIADLRCVLADLGVDAFVVPTDDPHLSEIPPACFARREFISGFTGSAGTVVITASEALLWTDGRYFLQAEQQLPNDWQLIRAGLPDTPTFSEWLAATLSSGQTVGIDPAVHPAADVADFRVKLEAEGLSLVCMSDNPVDKVWGNTRPDLPSAPVRVHPENIAGATASEKLEKLRMAMAAQRVDAFVVSTLDEVAYLLNLRGGDVERTPVVLAYALVLHECACLFVDSEKLPDEVMAHLKSIGCEVRPYGAAFGAVAELGAKGKQIWFDPKRTNFAIQEALGTTLSKTTEPSPIAAMKARKNASELDGMREAHRRDAAALAAAFAQLERRVAATEVMTEIHVDNEVTSQRAAQWGYLDNSFDTIAGYGKNGAIIHYRAEDATAATLGTSQLLLVDSGGQYLDGTTDVTRTFKFGQPTEHERECFTRVLKGHIALTTAIFPEGTPGFVLDAYARRPLWAAGLDYRHGTGHGVGAALGVHEGPQGIAQKYDNKTPLEAGMIVSNEPGYYKDGEFGIRIENLVVVVERETPSNFGGKKYFGFEELTLVPIQSKLIDLELLDAQELEYLNGYHARVRDEVAPLLDGENSQLARSWLFAATEPLCREPAVTLAGSVAIQ